MIRSLVTTFALVALAIPAFAQDDRLDDLSFEEVTIPDAPVPYFAIGAGPTFSLSFLNVDAVNTRGTELGFASKVSSPMLMVGVDVFAALPIIENLRGGFTWVAGNSRSTTTGTIPLDSGKTASFDRTYAYTVRQSSIYLDYAWVPFRSFAVLPGVAFGWGTQTIEQYQGADDRTWTDYGPTSLSAPDRYIHLEHDVLFVTPRLNVEYAVTPFLMVRAQAGYTIQVSESDWVGTRTSTVSGVPDNLNLQAFNAQLGIFVGLFN